MWDYWGPAKGTFRGAILVLAGALLACMSALHPCSGASSDPTSNDTAGKPAANRNAEAQQQQQQQAVKALAAASNFFIENKGQWDPSVRFGLTGGAVTIALKDSGPTFGLTRRIGEPADAKRARRARRPGMAPGAQGAEPTSEPAAKTGETAEAKGAGSATEPAETSVGTTESRLARRARRLDEMDDEKVETTSFSVAFDGANTIVPKGFDQAIQKVKYYRNSDPSTWQTDVPTWKGVLYEGLYGGIDLKVRPGPSGLAYEFSLAPGADVSKIQMKYEGVEGIRIDEAGRLRIKTSFGELACEAPVARQEADGQKKAVSIKYVLIGDKTCGFELTGPVDGALPLVIDS